MDPRVRRGWWLVILLTEPRLYFYRLARNTVFMGAALLALHYAVDTSSPVIAPQLHGIIGLVIGLLLVFRTNTAYDRWWEARKLIAGVAANLHVLVLTGARKQALREFNSHLFSMLRIDQADAREAARILAVNALADPWANGTDPARRIIAELIDRTMQLDRIKSTPIPASYAIHIKVSVFIYIASLPFGVFFGLGAWGILLVMLLFFIIAGIEIISEEIEDPFRGDPNDLPIDEYQRQNLTIIGK